MRFLIIDDDASLRVLLKKRLQKKWPVAVIETYDPLKSGIPDKNFPWENYNLVFLDYDLGLDNLTGLDVLASIKQQDNAPFVIMVTGHDSVDIAVKAIRQGANDYLIKYDVVTDKLFEMIDEALASGEISQDLKKIATSIQINPGESQDWQIPGYICISEIRKGQSTTLLAERLEDNLRVVLKVLTIQDAKSSAVLLKRFALELNILADFDHPNLIKVLDHGVTPNYAWYATEFMAQGDLAKRITQVKLTRQQIKNYILMIASGLLALHRKGIVHRDIKPSNILFKDDDTPVIADLGIAKDLSSDDAFTIQGDVLGTPYYMSLEQINGSPVDKRSDIYSLGVVLYELLTGNRPFTGESIMEVIYKHTSHDLSPLPDAVKDWQPVIDKMLAKNPADRYQDLEQFISAVNVIKT
jgi:DNA-binding NarL/FixJ family response regulator